MTVGVAQGRPWPVARDETGEQRRARVAHEAELIAQARAELEAGLGIEDDQLEAWLDQLEQDPEAPLPAPQADVASAAGL